MMADNKAGTAREPNILVAGIGNIFMGDDGFGVEVARRLRERAWPPDVRVEDFGIRSFDLVFALVSDCQVAILIDALARGEAPGTLYVFQPDVGGLDELSPDNMEGHGLHPAQVLEMAKLYGSPPERILVVGCEPATTGFAEGGEMSLSLPVQASLDEAVRLVESLVEEVRQEQMEKSKS